MDKKAMHKLSYGLYVVTTRDAEKANGCIVNTVIQAASGPNQICVCVNKANYTHDMLLKTGVFNVSVLSKTAQFPLYQRFGFQSGREVDKFADYTAYKNAENGVPYIIEGTNAYLAVKVSQTVDLGSHTMFIGEVTEMEVLSEEPSAVPRPRIRNRRWCSAIPSGRLRLFPLPPALALPLLDSTHSLPMAPRLTLPSLSLHQ